MRSLVAYELISLDGVAEDPSTFFTTWDDELDANLAAVIATQDAVLLGRRSYDEWAQFWPDSTVQPFADFINAVPKYVATRGAPDLPWENSHRLGDDLPAEIARLRTDHADVHVVRSIDFARTLVAEGLFDVLNLWMYPIVLGAGKRLFPAEGGAHGLTLLEPPVAGSAGAIALRYGPGEPVRTGDMT